MKLAAAGPETAEALAEVHAACFDRPWRAPEIAALLNTPATIALSAEDDGRLAGFIMLHKAADEAEVVTLGVRPDARQRGTGRALVEAGAALLAAAGVKVLWLEVAVDNEPALALYSAAGFEVSGRRPRYYTRENGARADALVLRRLLNSSTA